MQIDKDMTIVYDLKLNQLKDTSPYNKEWNVMYSMVPYVISDEELIKIFDVMKEWFREK